MRRAWLLSVLVVLGGCYQSHEREPGTDDGGSGASVDAATICPSDARATVRFEPPMTGDVAGIRVVLLGAAPEPAASGVRMHLDLCGGTPPCPLDLIVGGVGDVLSGLTFPPGATGTLTTRGETAYLRVSDERDCASCGGELNVLAGALTAAIDSGFNVRIASVACTSSCGDTRSLSIGGHGGSTLAAAGPPIVAPPLRVHVVTDYAEPCARCRCAEAPIDATGIVVAASGSFAR